MAQIKIDGIEYDIPTELKLAELQIVEQYSHGHMEADDSYGVGKLMGLIHVAIKRVRPELGFVEIKDVVDNLEGDALQVDEDADASPPAQENDDSSETSSDDSSDASDDPPAESLIVLATRAWSSCRATTERPRRADGRAADGLLRPDRADEPWLGNSKSRSSVMPPRCTGR